jgi:hypothetical protein
MACYRVNFTFTCTLTLTNKHASMHKIVYVNNFVVKVTVDMYCNAQSDKGYPIWKFRISSTVI